MCGLLVVEGSVEENFFRKALNKIGHRGPDHLGTKFIARGKFGFQRLKIMDLTEKGNQPFIFKNNISVINGEIYNHLDLEKKAEYQTYSQSDCEILLPYYKKFGLKKLVGDLDGEFAFVLWDKDEETFIAARDPLGIRPLFYGELKGQKNKMAFCSEMKGLLDLCHEIKPFPPGYYYDGKEFYPFQRFKKKPVPGVGDQMYPNIETISRHIKEKLENAVIKRLQSDAPLGYLLSGGLDSSLVCAIAQKHFQEKNQKATIRTFAIGIKEDAIDLKYARLVATFLGSEHTEFTLSFEEALVSLENIIYTLESWDVTTIRASMGMYPLARAIHKNTDIKTLLTGEVSDELFGYKYTDYAPDPQSFQKESEKRIKELYMYDVLRADRCLAAHSLEARVPFSDTSFVNYVLNIPPHYKMNTKEMGKYLLRKAFEKGAYLPPEILWREKTAFSDGIGHSVVDKIKIYAEKLFPTQDIKEIVRKKGWTFCPPKTSEALLYRMTFEKLFPGKSALIADYWMPNPNWNQCRVDDPSARALPNYGASGS